MERKYNVTGNERKELVKVISDATGTKAKYLGMPSAAYEIGDFTVTKDGTLLYEDGIDAKAVIQALADNGFESEKSDESTAESDTSTEEGIVSEAPDSDDVVLTVEIPLERVNLDNLNRLLEAKGKLIRKALGVESLPIEVRDDRVAFPWFTDITAEEGAAYTLFISALCQMAKEAKRVTASEKEVENEKYAFRCFLLRLGFIGKEYKAERKIFLKNLTGSAAFKSGSRKEAPGDEVSE